MLLLLPVQGGGCADEASVGVDGEELVPRAGQQAVPHHSVFLWSGEHSQKSGEAARKLLLFNSLFSLSVIFLDRAESCFTGTVKT